MTTVPCSRVIAERLGNGVFIEFDDGKSALFPASFLSSHTPWYQIDVPPDLDDFLDSPDGPC